MEKFLEWINPDLREKNETRRKDKKSKKIKHQQKREELIKNRKEAEKS